MNEMSGVDLANYVQAEKVRMNQCEHKWVHKTKTFLDYAANEKIREWDECVKCGKKKNTTERRIIEELLEDEIMR